MALMTWDTTTMEKRPATQQDIIELEMVRSAYARILARFKEDRETLFQDIKDVRSRAGMPNDLMVDPPRVPETKEG